MLLQPAPENKSHRLDQSILSWAAHLGGLYHQSILLWEAHLDHLYLDTGLLSRLIQKTLQKYHDPVVLLGDPFFKILDSEIMTLHEMNAYLDP